jgi:hypothetical protein
MKGWIYIASNPFAKGVVKIGCTSKDPDMRAKELSGDTGVPGQTLIQYACWIDDYESIEQQVHKVFARVRVVDSQEWFHLAVSDAIDKIRQTVVPIYEDIRIDGISISSSPELQFQAGVRAARMEVSRAIAELKNPKSKRIDE